MLALGLVATGLWLHEQWGREASFVLIAGAAFGVFLQRSRFCFFCILGDLFEKKDSRGVLGILAALAVGCIGYQVIFGAWIPDPSAGYPPPNAHIGPASWVVAAGGVIFGIGMVLSGSCISAHLYRLGEGSLLAPVALLGSAGGFILGFLSWNWLYLNAIAAAPVTWLPARFGYAGSLLIQLAALGVLAALLLRFIKPTPQERSAVTDKPPGLRAVWRAVFIHRWPTWIGGVAIGILGTFVYLRAEPLGVTAEIGRQSRRLADYLAILPTRLEGLDTMAGCRTADAAGVLGSNGIFVLALIAGALCAALLAGQFIPRRESPRAVVLALIGGVMLGFGAMISLGCTIGTLLSGIHAFALSGWLFFAGVVAGVWPGLFVRRLITARPA